MIDGCPLECARTCIEDHDVTPDHHVNLIEEGAPKEYHTDYDDDQAAALYDDLVDATYDDAATEARQERTKSRFDRLSRRPSRDEDADSDRDSPN